MPPSLDDPAGPDLADRDLPIAPGPIADGSQALRHDGYDVQVFQDACETIGRLGALVDDARRRLVTAPALIADLFWSFLKRAPAIAPVAPLTPAYQLNAAILAQLMGTVEWSQVRQAGTVGDPLTSAMATIGAAQRALAALDPATRDRVNQLHALESGADALFAQAAALDDLAAQAQGDRAVRLFQQAAEARARAAADRAAAAPIPQILADDTERIEDATRRAGRTGLAAATAEIDAATAAIATFGGGYGPGAGRGGGPLSTREKLALAQRVGQSPRLQQIAAICGRFTRIALAVQASKVQHPPDEITSITIGNAIGRILPSEIALLTAPTLEDLFFLKFAEDRLLQYDLIGTERQGQGPIIIALTPRGAWPPARAGSARRSGPKRWPWRSWPSPGCSGATWR